MIRVSTPADEPGEGRTLRGLVEHVGSADRTAFHEANELLAFLAETLERRAGFRTHPIDTEGEGMRGTGSAGGEPAPPSS